MFIHKRTAFVLLIHFIICSMFVVLPITTEVKEWTLHISARILSKNVLLFLLWKSRMKKISGPKKGAEKEKTQTMVTTPCMEEKSASGENALLQRIWTKTLSASLVSTTKWDIHTIHQAALSLIKCCLIKLIHTVCRRPTNTLNIVYWGGSTGMKTESWNVIEINAPEQQSDSNIIRKICTFESCLVSGIRIYL